MLESRESTVGEKFGLNSDDLWINISTVTHMMTCEGNNDSSDWRTLWYKKIASGLMDGWGTKYEIKKMFNLRCWLPVPNLWSPKYMFYILQIYA